MLVRKLTCPNPEGFQYLKEIRSTLTSTVSFMKNINLSITTKNTLLFVSYLENQNSLCSEYEYKIVTLVKNIVLIFVKFAFKGFE